MTQRQLGALLGYDHSLISHWERGERQPAGILLRRLDEVLESDGQLTSVLDDDAPATAPATATTTPTAPAPAPSSAARPAPAARRLLLPSLPPVAAPAAATAAAHALVDPLHWPARLPNSELTCPLHGHAPCPVPDYPGFFATLARGLPAGSPDPAETDLVHGLTALLECLVVKDRTELSPLDRGWVERILRLVVDRAEQLHRAGRTPTAQLILSGHYAVLAGRLRRQRGQNAAAMSWFTHGLRWSEASGDIAVRATLLAELSMLALAERDVESSLSYAQALNAASPRRGWTSALSHLYQARGYARVGDQRECLPHLTRARRRLDVLDARDREESPGLTGVTGLVFLEGTAGAALRDLSVATGDTAVARQAARATRVALEHLPDWKLPIRLLLTLRLADSYACAGDRDAARETAAPALRPAMLTTRSVIAHELRGLRRRLD